MDVKFQQIVGGVYEIFMQHGVKSPSMETIAKELKMSKKTLYKYVKDKEDLVLKVMEAVCMVEEHDLGIIRQEHENAIDETIAIAHNVIRRLQGIHPAVHYELESFYPNAWDRFQQYKKEFIFNCVLDNMERGIAQGYFRENMNAEIITWVYMEKMDMVFDAHRFPIEKHGFADVYLEMMRYHLRGIATEKGRKYLKEKLTNDNINLF